MIQLPLECSEAHHSIPLARRIFAPLMGAWDLDVSWHEQGVRVRRDRANGILHGFLRVAPFKMFGSSHLVACERNRPNYMNMVQACVFTIQRLMRGAQHGSAQCRRISTHSLREATTGASQ